MLTNSQETQVVRSLHVQLGGRSEPPAPMEAVRGALRHSRPLEQEVVDAVSWTPDALERLGRVPDFVRPMVKKGVEDAAKQQGLAVITPEVMATVRDQLGM